MTLRRRGTLAGRPLGRTAALAVLAVASAAATSLPDEPRTFSDTVVVREIEVWFDDSVLPQIESIGRRADHDFTVFQDGLPLVPVTVPTATGDGGRLEQVLVWLDPALASPAALAHCAATLAAAAPALAGAGPVEVATVGRHGVSSRHFTGVAPLVDELATLERRWRHAPSDRFELPRRLAAIDRLALDLVARDGAGPRALVVAVEPWPANPDLLNDLVRLERGEPPADTSLVALDEAGRLIAAYGWVAYALDAREVVTRRPPAKPRDEKGMSFGGAEVWPLFRYPIRDRTPIGRIAVDLDLATDFGLRPLAHLVRASSGTLVGEPGAIASELRRLADRRRLVVRSTDRGTAPLSRLEVRWTGGDGRPLPTLGWLRNGEPPEVAAARRRLAASGLP
ncbi:MAG: hypothetical protein AMXMBFR36_12410 [Acidobacteriota bacterium]